MEELLDCYYLDLATAKLIKSISVKIVYYSCCLDNRFGCKVNKSLSQRYSEYLRVSQPYDVVNLSLEGVRRLIADKSKTQSALAAAKSRREVRLQAFLASKSEVERLEKRTVQLESRSTELICRSLRSVDEIEEEDRRNREARFTVEHAEVAAVGNDTFDPEAFERQLSGNLGSVGEIARAVYYNTLDV